MQIINIIVSPDERRRKYYDRKIIKILVLLNIFNRSYRSAYIFLSSNEEYLRMIGITEIPGIQTLSRSARMSDINAINREISFLYAMES